MSRFSVALSKGEAIDVPMNSTGYVSFTGCGTKAIGIGDLNGSTAVLLVSMEGAFLCNISPLPFLTEDPYAGENHTRVQMREFLEMWDSQYDFRYAPGDKISIVVCGFFQDEVALPDQIIFIRDILLENLEDNPEPRFWRYDIQEPGTRSLNAGTIFVDGNGSVPKLYVDDVDQHWFDTCLSSPCSMVLG